MNISFRRLWPKLLLMFLSPSLARAAAPEFCAGTLLAHIDSLNDAWVEHVPSRNSVSLAELSAFVQSLRAVPEFQCFRGGCTGRSQVIAYALYKDLGVSSAVTTVDAALGTGGAPVFFRSNSVLQSFYGVRRAVSVQVDVDGQTVEYIIDYPYFDRPIPLVEWTRLLHIGERNTLWAQSPVSKQFGWGRDILRAATADLRGALRSSLEMQTKVLRRSRQVETLLQSDDGFRTAWQNEHFRAYFLTAETVYDYEGDVASEWKGLWRTVQWQEKAAAWEWERAKPEDKPRLAYFILDHGSYSGRHIFGNTLIPIEKAVPPLPSRRELMEFLGYRHEFKPLPALTRTQREYLATLNTVDGRMTYIAYFIKETILTAEVQVALGHALRAGLSREEQRHLLLEAGMAPTQVGFLVDEGFLDLASLP